MCLDQAYKGLEGIPKNKIPNNNKPTYQKHTILYIKMQKQNEHKKNTMFETKSRHYQQNNLYKFYFAVLFVKHCLLKSINIQIQDRTTKEANERKQVATASTNVYLLASCLNRCFYCSIRLYLFCLSCSTCSNGP